MKHTIFALMIVSIVIAASPGNAHHSWPAVFKQEEITIEGVVTKFLFRNPHSWLFVNVTDSDGNVIRWDVEMGPAMAYSKRGMTKDTFKAGDKVKILGNPGRKNPRWLHLIGLYRLNDGWIFGQDPRSAAEKASG